MAIKNLNTWILILSINDQKRKKESPARSPARFRAGPSHHYSRPPDLVFLENDQSDRNALELLTTKLGSIG